MQQRNSRPPEPTHKMFRMPCILTSLSWKLSWRVDGLRSWWKKMIKTIMDKSNSKRFVLCHLVIPWNKTVVECKAQLFVIHSCSLCSVTIWTLLSNSLLLCYCYCKYFWDCYNWCIMTTADIFLIQLFTSRFVSKLMLLIIIIAVRTSVCYIQLRSITRR